MVGETNPEDVPAASGARPADEGNAVPLGDDVVAILSADDGMSIVSDLGDLHDQFRIAAGDAIFVPEAPEFLAPDAIPLDRLNFGGPKSCAFLPERPHGGTRFGWNISDQWQLSGGNTAYLEIPQDEQRVSFRYADAGGSEIPVVPGVTYSLDGHFAVHRVRARVALRMYGEGGKLLSSREVELSPAWAGGKMLSQYQSVHIESVAPPGAEWAGVLIVYDGPTETTEGLDGYVFCCDLSLFTAGSRASYLKVLYQSRFEKSKLNAGLYKYRVPLDLDVLNRDRQDIRLLHGETVVETLYRFPPAGTSSGEIHLNGKAITFKSDYSGICLLFVDGQFCGTGQKNRVSNVFDFPVPDRCFDANFHFVEIRDQSGIAIVSRDYIFIPPVLTPWQVLQSHTTSPLPSNLAPAASHRYRALNNQLKHFPAKPDAYDVWLYGNLANLHAVLEAGFENLRKFPPLRFREVESPDVSIVIPAKDKANVTYFCFCALLLAYNDASFEVILVDDGSEDETTQFPELVEGLRYVRNETPQGFVRACNLGADQARGKYIVFLNNDTEPTTGWLDELLAAFDTFDKVGLAGSRLLYPDGRQQEAGGVVWNTGNPWNYGRLANPHDPRFCYARQADYLSGAAIILPRRIWKAIGGFSSDFVPAYFEDTDIAFKVREHGYKTIYVPHSVIYHFEGISSGTDTSTGMKRFQEINRPKFKRRWADSFRGNGQEGADVDLEKDRGIKGRVLFLDYGTPQPNIDAGGYAAVQEMRMVQALGYKVTLLPENMAYFGSHTEKLQRMGVETIYAPFYLSVPEFLEKRGAEFDVIYVTRYEIAARHLEEIRSKAPKARIVFNNADLHFMRELRAALRSNNSADIERSIGVRDSELAVIRQVDLTLSYNEVEHAVIASHVLNSGKVMKCPWVEELRPSVPSYSRRSGIAFLGGFGHPPNLEAVEFFIRSVMPGLSDVDPDLTFHVYGSRMPESLKKLESDVVKIHGYVDEVSEVYDTCRVFVAPLLSGAGIKGKVLSAFSHGVPTVLSPIAVEGTGARSSHECLVAETPEEWVDAIIRLYTDKNLWQKISKGSRDIISESYSFENGVKHMRRAFEAVGMY